MVNPSYDVTFFLLTSEYIEFKIFVCSSEQIYIIFIEEIYNQEVSFMANIYKSTWELIGNTTLMEAENLEKKHSL